MTDTTAPPGPAPEVEEPPGLNDQITRQIKARLVLDGQPFYAIEDALDMSHAKAIRRSSGETDWTFEEIEAFAKWKNMDIIFELRPRSRSRRPRPRP